jgi:DNA-directed RNA polymerase subunit RPC12/RpoP
MHHVRLYRHINAEYVCTECNRGRTLIESCILPLDLIVATCVGLPIAIMLLRNAYLSWWYCLIAIAAGELLTLYAAGFISNILLVFHSRGTIRCRECGGLMLFTGRHFDPAGDAEPRHSDFVILGIFILLNVAFWIIYARGGFA